MKTRAIKFAAISSSANQNVSTPFGATNYMGEVVITGTASVQFSGSNDNSNFTSIGSAVTTTDRVVPLNSNNEVYKYLRAATTITGTGTATNAIYFQ